MLSWITLFPPVESVFADLHILLKLAKDKVKGLLADDVKPPYVPMRAMLKTLKEGPAKLEEQGCQLLVVVSDAVCKSAVGLKHLTIAVGIDKVCFSQYVSSTGFVNLLLFP